MAALYETRNILHRSDIQIMSSNHNRGMDVFLPTLCARISLY
jgi:hypothetical protein